MLEEVIGFIGLGNMGRPIVQRMLQCGRKVVVFDINPATISQLVALGATPAASIREVADNAPVVLACLPTGGIVDAAREAALGAAIEVYGELSTMAPEVAQAIASIVAAQGIEFVDGTVSGGMSLALEGKLSYMIAGSAKAMDRVASAMGPVIAHVWRLSESPGHAQLCKLVNNAVGFTLFIATCEALAVGVAAGLEPRGLIDAINHSSGVNHWTRDKFIGHVLSRSFDAGGKMEAGPPAFDLYLEQARRVGMPAGIIQSGRDNWLEKSREFDDPTIDFSNLVRWYEKQVGAKLESRIGTKKSAAGSPAASVLAHSDSPLGFIGLGNMGGAIVRRLINEGVQVVGFDQNIETMTSLVAAGLIGALSAIDVADRAEMIFACLPDPAASRFVATEVMRGSAVKVYAELSTIGPNAIGEIEALISSKGIHLVDMPVSGGIKFVANGTIAVLLAGPAPGSDAAAVIAARFGRVIRLGDQAGHGQICKIVNNALNFTALIASMEAIAVGVALGMNGKALTDAMSVGSGLSSATMEKFPRAVLNRSLRLGGHAKGVLKDLDLYLEKAHDLGIRSGVIADARALWERAMLVTGPEEDLASVVRYFEAIVGAEISA